MMKKGLLAMSLASVMGIGMAQESVDSIPQNKIIDNAVLLAESKATNPLGVMGRENAEGYLMSLRKKIGENGIVLLNNYYSSTAGFGHNPNIKYSQNLTPNSDVKVSASGQYFLQNDSRSDMAVVSGSVAKKDVSADYTHWNFLNGNSKNAVSLEYAKDFGKSPDNIFKAKAKVIDVLDQDFNQDELVGQLSVSKNIGNGWNVNSTLQTNFESDPVVGFGITKKW